MCPNYIFKTDLALVASTTQWCIILRSNLKVARARESRPDGEGKHARRRKKSATFFTPFLIQKLSRFDMLALTCSSVFAG